MWIMLVTVLIVFMRDQAGQLEESGEYRMGRVTVVYFHIRSSEGDSPHLCRLPSPSPQGALIMY
jgi:hypothetical protein